MVAFVSIGAHVLGPQPRIPSCSVNVNAKHTILVVPSWRRRSILSSPGHTAITRHRQSTTSRTTTMLYGSGGGGPGAKPDVLIRIISCVPYLVPLLDSLMYGRFVFEKVPALSTFVLNPLVPLYSLYRGIPFLAFGIFLALYFLVVRNTNVPRFIRFNAQQAITLDILLIIPQLFSSFSGSNVVPNNIVEMASNSVFYSMLLAVIYAVVTNLKGEYPDQIPGVSESVESQIGPF